ncbi:FkbM family methyltransferase [Prosthecobacter sp.]|uniref:FkbM family methyltransferase n=1 Tax=Prosthecobacter sp. TaxID=1965333 RepID=UPI003783C7AD
MNLLPKDCGHQPIAYTGIYEWPVTKRMAKLARAGGCLVDVGANAGYFSLLWCGLNRANHAEAFEALPANVDRLRKNIEINEMQDLIRLHAHALGRTDGVIAFETGQSEQSGWGGIASAESKAIIEVPVRRLDPMFNETDGPITVKIDCEGADSWVMEGAKELLSRPMVRNVFFEVNEPRQLALGIPMDASQQILRGLGFCCEQIDANDWHAHKK